MVKRRVLGTIWTSVSSNFPVAVQSDYKHESIFFMKEGALFRSYLSRHLRKPIVSRDQLVVLSVLRTLLSDACYEVAATLLLRRRLIEHRPPKLSAGRRPVASSVSAIDVIEYKVSGQGFHYVLSVFDYLARFLTLVPLVDKSMSAVVRALVDHGKVRK